jgi:hypothetical protein
MKNRKQPFPPEPPYQATAFDDRFFLSQCYSFLLQGWDPEEFSSPGFVRELLWRYINAVQPTPLTGADIAAQVERAAIRLGSIAKAVQHVSIVLGPAFSKAAIQQAYKRNKTKSAAQIREEYEEYYGLFMGQEDPNDALVAEHEIKMRQINSEIAEWKKKTLADGKWKREVLRGKIKKVQKR